MHRVVVLLVCVLGAGDVFAELTVPQEHPRLLGTRAELQELARQRPQEFARVQAVARDEGADSWSRGVSLALVGAIEGDKEAQRTAHGIAMKLVTGPIRQGHVTFGTDLALSGLIYDLCHEAWSDEDKPRFHDYFNKTVDANVESETHVFHNAWFSYKNWGIGIGALAAYHENRRAKEIYAAMEKDYLTRAAPALTLAGKGGSWAEGYYIHYWLYEWLFFCEVARKCAGVDYYKAAPEFYGKRALASAFEMYPGLSEYNTRRPAPMGDGGGRRFGGDRDKALAARRIMVNYHRDDSVHQSLHTYNEQTPRVGAGVNAYKDFLWRDSTVMKGDLKKLPLSHYAAGPGFVFSRSSWEEDATWFFFKAGDRFTAHQHLDNGHFLTYRTGELLGDGGHYEAFGSAHDVNYHMRTIAHSTVLVRDPDEKWPAIRGGRVTGNDGGQHHNWPHHNGAVSDPQEWNQNRALYDIADITGYEDRGEFMWVTADLTRSYSSNKMERFIRRVVHLRPSTFVIVDEVLATKPEFKKTWLLQAMTSPIQDHEGRLVITNERSRLVLQTLAPEQAEVKALSGEQLYRYDGMSFPPRETTGPAPQARVEISPHLKEKRTWFVNVLTVSGEEAASEKATLERSGETLRVRVGARVLEFFGNSVQVK